jgi:aminopeptidase 2
LSSSYNTIEKWLNANIPVEEIINYRLPKDLVPYNYDLLFKIQFDNIVNDGFSYEGEVTMYVRSVKDTSNLIFHTNKLLINNATLSVKSLTDQTFGEIKAFSWRNDFERQFFVANLTKTLKANQNYTIFVKFTGYLTDDNAGFYRSSYFDNNQQRR